MEKAAATPEDAGRVLDLFAEASELPPDERPAFLTRVCAGDDALRAEIESLLRCEVDTGAGFLAEPAFERGLGLFADTANGELQAGEILGDCRIIALLGIGGMGEVYLAEDMTNSRRVAIKLIRGGRGSGDVLLRHFRHERRVLAGLNDPHIARLYGSAVTPEGRAYLVMEYVEGERLDAYCDRRQLGVPERLALFRKVCSAVAYAHQNLVVHRDLKPANIRVTAEGEPKLLDFGIAKLLDLDTNLGVAQTLTLNGSMTPEYASPEQLRGENITTASDVYSLGVLLYELLTGQRPYQVKNRRPEEVARAICEQEPARPSTVVKRRKTQGAKRKIQDPAPPTDAETSSFHPAPAAVLHADLDNIVALAMRKEPARRYASVTQFSEDIRRHLEGLPVIARPDTFAYRAGKFVRRNKTAVAAASLAVLALVAGMITTTWQARRANRRFDDLRALANSLLFEVEPKIANLPGSTEAQSLLVARALTYLDGLSTESGGNRELRGELAAAYEKVASVQGNPNYPNLGDLKGALASYLKAKDLRLSLVKAQPHEAQARHDLASNYEEIGNLLWWSNQTDGALVNMQAALKLRRVLLAEQPASADFRRGFCSVQMSLGDVDHWNDRQAEALAKFGEALPILKTLAAEHPGDTEAQVNVVRCLTRMGASQKSMGDYAAAADTFARSESILEPIIRRDPNNYSAALESWFVVFSECEAFNDAKQWARSLAICPRMVSMAEHLAQEDPKNQQGQHNLADSLNYYGEALFEVQRWQEAIDELQRGLEIDTRLLDSSPENGEYPHSCGTFHLVIGRAKLHLGQLDAAEAEEQTAQKLLQSVTAKDPSNVAPRRELVKVYTTLGEIYGQRQQEAESRRWYQQALTDFEGLLAGKTASANDREDLDRLHRALADQ